MPFFIISFRQIAKKKEYKFRDKVYREGDRVMQIRNNYDLFWEKADGNGHGIFNGDIGVIESIDFREETINIWFDKLKKKSWN